MASFEAGARLAANGASGPDGSQAEGKLLLLLTEIGDLVCLLDMFTRPHEIQGSGLANLLFGLWLGCGEMVGYARAADSLRSQPDARRFGVPADLLERLGRARASTAHEPVRLLGRHAATYCEWTLEAAFWLRELLVHRVAPALDPIARGHNIGESSEADQAIFAAAAEHQRDWFLAEFAGVAAECAEHVFLAPDLDDVPKALDEATNGVRLEFRRLRSTPPPGDAAYVPSNGHREAPLTPTEKMVDEVIRAMRECDLNDLAAKTGTPKSTLTRHTIPGLKKKRGLKSKPYRYD
ncbi:MAG TPA: hypothetical protein VFH56_17120 [Acidimicrobiales bacterium]|nr:hypothetical protein [Acidimicrobiales bacterium]